jgi:outer membrane usher protein FimD/PapC
MDLKFYSYFNYKLLLNNYGSKVKKINRRIEPSTYYIQVVLNKKVKEREKNVFPTSSLKMTFPSLNLEMKVRVCITCEESKSLPSLVGKVKQKFDPHLGMYILSLK